MILVNNNHHKTFRAPASLAICTSSMLVVPLTMLSSTSSTFFPTNSDLRCILRDQKHRGKSGSVSWQERGATHFSFFSCLEEIIPSVLQERKRSISKKHAHERYNRIHNPEYDTVKRKGGHEIISCTASSRELLKQDKKIPVRNNNLSTQPLLAHQPAQRAPRRTSIVGTHGALKPQRHHNRFFSRRPSEPQPVLHSNIYAMFSKQGHVDMVPRRHPPDGVQLEPYGLLPLRLPRHDECPCDIPGHVVIHVLELELLLCVVKRG